MIFVPVFRLVDWAVLEATCRRRRCRCGRLRCIAAGQTGHGQWPRRAAPKHGDIEMDDESRSEAQKSERRDATPAARYSDPVESADHEVRRHTTPQPAMSMSLRQAILATARSRACSPWRAAQARRPRADRSLSGVRRCRSLRRQHCETALELPWLREGRRRRRSGAAPRRRWFATAVEMLTGERPRQRRPW